MQYVITPNGRVGCVVKESNSFVQVTFGDPSSVRTYHKSEVIQPSKGEYMRAWNKAQKVKALKAA